MSRKHISASSNILDEDINPLLVTLAYAHIVGVETAELQLASGSYTISLERIGDYLDGRITREEVFYGCSGD